jgi:hypothetical protein
MGYCDNTAFVATGDADAVCAAILAAIERASRTFVVERRRAWMVER